MTFSKELDRFSLHFFKISLQIRNCREETGPIRTVSSANQSGLQLTFLRHPGISAVARYFAGGSQSPVTGVGDSTGVEAAVSRGRF